VVDPKFVGQCFMCGREQQIGPHRYAGRYIQRYRIRVCQTCYDANHDGWAPEYEEKLIAHLGKEGLETPKRNQAGWFPRE